VSLGCVGAGQFLVVSEVFWLALCRVLLPCKMCFEGLFVLGPREVTEPLYNICCAAAVATGLTDFVHRSDRRRPLVRPAQAIGLTGVAHAASRASFRCACW
jgi:hypothetical protein